MVNSESSSTTEQSQPGVEVDTQIPNSNATTVESVSEAQIEGSLHNKKDEEMGKSKPSSRSIAVKAASLGTNPTQPITQAPSDQKTTLAIGEGSSAQGGEINKITPTDKMEQGEYSRFTTAEPAPNKTTTEAPPFQDNAINKTSIQKEIEKLNHQSTSKEITDNLPVKFEGPSAQVGEINKTTPTDKMEQGEYPSSTTAEPAPNEITTEAPPVPDNAITKTSIQKEIAKLDDHLRSDFNQSTSKNIVMQAPSSVDIVQPTMVESSYSKDLNGNVSVQHNVVNAMLALNESVSKGNNNSVATNLTLVLDDHFEMVNGTTLSSSTTTTTSAPKLTGRSKDDFIGPKTVMSSSPQTFDNFHLWAVNICLLIGLVTFLCPLVARLIYPKTSRKRRNSKKISWK